MGLFQWRAGRQVGRTKGDGFKLKEERCGYWEEILACEGGEALGTGCPEGFLSLKVSRARLDGVWSNLG